MVPLRITEKTEFMDELSVNCGRQQLPDLQAYAEGYLNQPGEFEDLIITVENRQLTHVAAPFHPGFRKETVRKHCE